MPFALATSTTGLRSTFCQSTPCHHALDNLSLDLRLTNNPHSVMESGNIFYDLFPHPPYSSMYRVFDIRLIHISRWVAARPEIHSYSRAIRMARKPSRLRAHGHVALRRPLGAPYRSAGVTQIGLRLDLVGLTQSALEHPRIT